MPVETLKELGHRPLIMGIVNVTPDSFSGDGAMGEAAIRQALQMIADGADILDIGGESSRPGATPVEAEEEIRRVLPVIEAVAKQHPAVPLSVDTVKASVAEAALKAGASIVNDISALAHDEKMAKLVAETGAYIVLMHNRSGGVDESGASYMAPVYENVVDDVAADLTARIEAAMLAGIGAGRMIGDPGIGFGKTPEQNCALINHLNKLKTMLGCPVMLGASRKSFIGKILDLPVEERLEGTAASVAVGIMRGANILRVHDVKAMARVARMTAAIARV